MKKSTRVQQIRITQSNEYWKQIDELSFQVKNLYNAANYIIRQEFITTSKEKEEGLKDKGDYINYYKLDPMMHEYDEYKRVSASIAQQTLRLLDKNWKSFFAAIKDWGKHPEKYNGRPRLPKYLDKENGRFVICFKNQKVSNRDGYVYFSYTPFKNMNHTFKTIRSERFLSARIVPRLPDYILELVYEVMVPEQNDESKRIASIDLGVNNLMAVVNNCQEDCFIINGRPLKSINQYYNKVKGQKQSALKIKNNRYSSKAINSLTKKRNYKIDDYINKATKYMVSWCVEHNIDTLVCGHEKKVFGTDKVDNQNLSCIPFNNVIQQLSYKCEDRGIKFIEVEESYTSGTSFLDGEEPIEKNYDKSRRKSRGMFVANDGTQINADVNGAYQIMKKAFPDAFADGMDGISLRPIIVNV